MFAYTGLDGRISFLYFDLLLKHSYLFMMHIVHDRHCKLSSFNLETKGRERCWRIATLREQ